MKKWLSSLRLRLILLALLVVLPALGLLYYADATQRRSAAAHAQEEVMRLVRLAAAEQTQLIENGRQLLVALAQLPAVRDQDPAACQALFANLLAQYPFYSGLKAVTPSGDVFCSAPPITSPVNFSDRTWYQRLVQTTTFVLSDYQIESMGVKPVVVLAYPVLNAAGQLQAIVTAELDLDWFSQLAAEAQLPSGSIFSVIDRSGTVLARAPDPADWVGRSMPETSIVQTVLAQGEGIAEQTGLDGVGRLYGYAPLNVAPHVDVGAYVNVGIPSDVVYAEAKAAFVRHLVTLGLAAALGLGLAWMVGHRPIVNRLNALLDETERLTAGDLTARTSLAFGPGKFGDLARAFDRMAGALEQHEEELRRVNQALRTTSECNQALMRATDESDLLQTACQIVAEIGGYRLAWVGYAQQDEAKSIRPIAQAGFEDGYLDALNLTWADAERGRGPTGTAIRTGEPAIARDILTDPSFAPWREQALARGYASSIALPLRVDGRVRGALNVYATEPDAFNAEEVALLAELADDLSYGITALRTRAAHEQAERASAQRQMRLVLVNQVATGIRSGASLDEIIARSVEQISSFFPNLRVAYSTTDEQGTLKVLQSLQPAEMPSLTGWEISVAEAPALLQALWGDELVIVQDVTLDPHLMRLSEIAPNRRLGALLAAPLRHSQELAGVLSFDTPTPHRWTEHEAATLAAVADFLAVAIGDARMQGERRRSREKLQKYAERLSALHAIDTAILGAWSPEELVQAALGHMLQLTPCLGAGVLVFDHKTQESVLLAAEVGKGTDLEPGIRFPLGDAPEIQALRTGQVLQVHEFLPISQVPSVFGFLQERDVHSLVAAPLIVQGELIGCLGMGWARPNAFTPEQVDIIREVANQVAVGLHQARLRLALEVEEQRLQALVENLPEGVLLLDGEYRLLLSNPMARDYLAILEEGGSGDGLTHLAGRPLEELVRPRPQGMQHELKVPGPPEGIFELTARSMSKRSGVEGWLLLIRDVTMEREGQRRMQQQDRLAAVGQLAAGIAHDFNNIMATVVLYSGILLRSKGLSTKERERLQVIGQQGHRAANLVQQILDFARKSVLDRQPLELVPFLKELEKLLARTLPENIQLHLVCGDGNYVVNADPTRVQQVIMNLALNARDAMPKGGELGFELSQTKIEPKDRLPLPEMSCGDWVCLKVIDTGMGIPPDVLPHIFEPFFTTKEVGQGTGLGLAQVHGIVTQHEGYIDVESQVGRGTTFAIYLPALRLVPVMPEALEQPALAEGQGETILVVEDNPTTRAAMAETLELLGYAVLTAENGEEALRIFEDCGAEIALVLSDLVMPKMGGAELHTVLVEKYPGVKMVAITGYPLENDGKTLLELGIAAWIQKPFSAEQFGQTLREVLHG